MCFRIDTYPAASFFSSILLAPFLLRFPTTIPVEEGLGIIGFSFLVSLPSQQSHRARLLTTGLVYKKYGSTVLSSVALSTNTPVFWIADADALKTVTTEKFLFQKELEFVCPLP
jgi:hypothetical protein